MQTYDIIMLAVLAGCTFFGAWKGMAWQLASLSSLGVSYLVALKFSDQLAPYLGEKAPVNRLAAMLVLYLATSLAVWLAFRVVASIIDRVKLTEFDKQVGALFGLAKGVLLCVVITFFAVSLSETARNQILRSRSGHYIAVLIDKADPMIPPDIHDVLGPYLHDLDQRLDPGYQGGADYESALESEVEQSLEALETVRRFGAAIGEHSDEDPRY